MNKVIPINNINKIMLSKKILTLGVGLAGLGGATAALAIEYGQGKSDEFSKLPWGVAHVARGFKQFREDMRQTFAEPSQPVLLPPPIGAAYDHTPYTLVFELTGILVKPEWTYKTGWRFKKRPYIEYFLKQCGPPQFELVVYTQEQGSTAFPMIDALDSQGYISYRLFKDSTKYIKGTHVKELNQLGRDMRRVIHLDWNQEACQTSPQNCFILKKWDGDSSDKTLVELSDFIKEIANLGVDDVRPVLRYYSQFDDPLAKFQDNQRKADEMKVKGTVQPGGWKILSRRFTTSSSQSEELTLNAYNEAADNKLEDLSDKLEQALESRYDRGADVSLSNGVLTVVVDRENTFVINKQTPNKQIWLSSPVSGPARFDYVQGRWMDQRRKVELTSVLSDEISKLVDNKVELG